MGPSLSLGRELRPVFRFLSSPSPRGRLTQATCPLRLPLSVSVDDHGTYAARWVTRVQRRI